MSVYTHDVLIQGIKRDDVLAWLSVPGHHARVLEGAWGGMSAKGDGEYDLQLTGAPRPRSMHYRFDRLDDDHGGRRVHVETKGRRVNGHLHYSLRTMKPSMNTLVTLHADFGEMGVLGQLSEQLGLRATLDAGFKKMLENLEREIRKG